MVLKMVVSSYKFVFIQVALVISVTIIQCAKQPHLLFILADDYGWNDIDLSVYICEKGYHGSEIKTPNLDALAAEGVKLENYYVQPICTPSRSQLMSGRYHIYTGLQHNTINAAQPNGLPLEMPTLANKLKDVGYSTHMVGKWHLGFYKKEYLPTYRGFDSFYGYLTGNEDYYTHTACVITNCGLDFHNNTVNVWTENGTYSAMDFTRKAEEIAANHDPDKPLFLYLPYQSVHAPLEAPQKYIDKHKNIQSMERRKYAGMVSVLDEAVKNVTDAFKKYGLWDNTVMIFSTDNGGPTENAANNWPLRGEKFTLWEGGVHGVGFVNSPLLQMTKYTNKQFIHVSDWYPTLVHLAGGSTKGIKLDGFDQWETINMNQQSPRKELLHNIDLLYPPIGKRLYQDSYDNRFRAAIRVGDMKLLTGSVGEDRWTPPPHLEGHIFQPLYFKDDTKNVWLFNITADPTEHHDLSESHPQIVKQLLDRLAYYNSTAVPCRYPGNDPKSYPHLHGGAWVPWRD